MNAIISRAMVALAALADIGNNPAETILRPRRGPAGNATRRKSAGLKGRAAKGRWPGTAGKIRP